MGLVVNENKTKYMAMTRNASVKGTLYAKGLIFKQVGSSRANINETNKQIICVHKCYFTTKETFSFDLLSRRTKKQLY